MSNAAADRETLTDNEQAFLATVRKHLLVARKDKANGEISFIAHLKEGGISDKYVACRLKEK